MKYEPPIKIIPITKIFLCSLIKNQITLKLHLLQQAKHQHTLKHTS